MADFQRYIGHPSQICGVEEHRLIGGKGDGMRIFQVRNGKGLEFTVLADRCADISRLSFDGVNMSYMSPCGYVSPQYYHHYGADFLKSFTCGFLTTCGLTTIGTPSEDAGVHYPLHGNISNTPSEHIYYDENEQDISIHALISDSVIFQHKIELKRSIICSKKDNTLILQDKVTNTGSVPSPLMLLYHFNLGYPLLDETVELSVSSNQVEARDSRALEGINNWNQMLPPDKNFTEQCYYHHFQDATAKARLYNPTIKKGLSMEFDTQMLPYLVEWKMLGERDYVLGLEPCNHKLDGRKTVNESGKLKWIAPGECQTFNIAYKFFREG